MHNDDINSLKGYTAREDTRRGALPVALVDHVSEQQQGGDNSHYDMAKSLHSPTSPSSPISRTRSDSG